METRAWRRSLPLSLAGILVLAAAVLVGSMALPTLRGESAISALAAPACREAHVVRRGETLNLIAQRYGVTMLQLAEANGLPNYDIIYIGQTLCLPSAGGFADLQQHGDVCVEGRKIDENYVGLGGFTITAQMDGMEPVQAITDGAGFFHFDHLSPGLWTFSEDVPRGWESMTSSEFEQQLAYGHQGCYQIRFMNREVPIPACLVVAKADEATGTPMEGWEIQVMPSSGGDWTSGVTDGSGEVRFDGLEPGLWLVREILQYPLESSDPPTGQAEVILYPMEDQNDCSNLVFKNQRRLTGCVEGFKVDETHRSLAGGTVCASPRDAPEPVLCTVTDEDGYFVFADLSLGEWVLWEELEPGWRAMTASQFSVLVDELESCKLVRFKNQAPDLCAEGYSLDDEGFGIADWTIRAWPRGNSDKLLETTTDAHGKYRFCGVTLGTWVFGEEHLAGWRALSGEEQELLITFPGAGMDVQAPIFRNVPPRGCIEGWKVDELDIGLPLWSITVENVETGEAWHRSTDGTGYFQVCGLPMGHYQVWEEAQPAWRPISPPVVEVRLEARDEDVVGIVVFVNEQLERDICIDGHTRDALDGAGLPNWQIRLLDLSGNLLATTTTDGTGYYHFDDLEPGTYAVEETMQDGWWSTSGTVRKVAVSFPPKYECAQAEFTNAQRTATPKCLTWHVVQKYETLSIISLRYGISLWSIMAANGIVDPNVIWLGQGLCIPDHQAVEPNV